MHHILSKYLLNQAHKNFNLSAKKLEVGNFISLYRWSFELNEAHPNTKVYLENLKKNFSEKIKE